MSSSHHDIDTFLDTGHHPRRPEIDRLRRAILDAAPTLTENVKWNAPNYAVDDVDLVTFRLQPTDRVELIFHRGSKRRDVSSFTFDDPSGLIAWVAPDRGVIACPTAEHTAHLVAAIPTLVPARISAAAGS